MLEELVEIGMLELRALGVSVAIEGLIALALGWVWGLERWSLGWAAVGVTCVTHPIAWRLFGLLFPLGFGWSSVVVESGVVLVEGLLYRGVVGCSWKRCFGLSIVANGMSYGVGVLMFRL